MSAKLSARAQRLPASAIRRLVPLAVEAKARGVHVHHLNIGQPDVWSPSTVIDAMHRYDEPLVAYTMSRGVPEYVDVLREYYAGYGVTLSRDEINVTTGGSEALLFAMLAIMDPGDEILIPEPYYTNYTTFAQMAGGNVVPVTTTMDEGFRLPPRERIEAALTPRTRAVLLCNPSNPTGVVYTQSEIESMAALCASHNLWLIVDEVYREFVFEPGPETCRTALALDAYADRVIVIDSVSKRFSMCGARVGCVVSRHEGLMRALLRLSDARLSPPAVGQVLASHAYHAPPEYLDAAVETYRARRDLAFARLADIPGARAVLPGGAFYMIARLPVTDSLHFGSWLLTDFSRDGETVMVAPAGGFYATPGLGDDEVRLAFVIDLDPLARAMDLLAEALKVYPGPG